MRTQWPLEVHQLQEMIDKGLLGQIYNFRGEYYHTGYQNPERPLTWRMDIDKSGGGALVDMGVHVIDLIRHLLVAQGFHRKIPPPGC